MTYQMFLLGLNIFFLVANMVIAGVEGPTIYGWMALIAIIANSYAVCALI